MSTMKRLSILFTSSIILFVVLLSPALAKVTPAPTATPTPSPAPTPAAVDSYVLFWPLVAGKTPDDPLYALKKIKEKIQGILIFDDAKKAEYEIVLATKRLLEAEKLLKNGKQNLAASALENVKESLNEALEQVSDTSKDSKSVSKVKEELKNKLSNISLFIPQLKTGTEEKISLVLNEIDKQVKTLQEKLQ